MSQITLELNSRDDLKLLLDLAKRLNLNVVSVKPSVTKKAEKTPPTAVDLMKIAAEDPLFLADIEAVMGDFEHADLENA